MKHIRFYQDFNPDAELNEGLREWLIGGLLSLGTIGHSQDMDRTINATPTTRTEKQIHQSQLDSKAISGFLRYAAKINQQKGKLSYTRDGKYTLIKGQGFSASVSEGRGYNKYSCFIGFGSESKPDAEIGITLHDDGTISLYFGDERRKEDLKTDLYTIKKGGLLMDQTELRMGDRGYDEAMDILNMFNRN